MTRRGSNNRDGNGGGGPFQPFSDFQNCPASSRNASPAWEGDHRASHVSPTSDNDRTGRAPRTGPATRGSDAASRPTGQQAAGGSDVARTSHDNHAEPIADGLAYIGCPGVQDVLHRACRSHSSAGSPRPDPPGVLPAPYITWCPSGSLEGLVTALRDDELYAAVRHAYAAITGRAAERKPPSSEHVEQVARHLDKEEDDAERT